MQTLILGAVLLLTATPCGGDVTADFNKILEEFWDWRLEDSPEFATSVGEHKYNDRATSYNITVYPQRKAKVDQFIAALNQLDSKSLSKANQVNYDIFKDALNTYATGYEWFKYGALNPVTFLEGFQTDPSYITAVMPFKTKLDFENYLKRLELTELRLAEQTELFREAIVEGRTLNNVSLDRVPDQIDKIISVSDVTYLSLYAPFNATLENITTITENDKALLRAKAAVVLQNHVVGPYSAFKTFLENEYMPQTRTGWGVSSWDRGQEYYKACLKWHLSEDKTAQEIHDLGVAEVERISGQMLKVIRGHNFNGTIREYFQMLKENSDFKLATGEEILERYRYIVEDRVDPQLSKYFDNIPNLPLVIKPMPNDGPGGAYSGGSADGTRPGTFWVNVIRPNDTNTFDMMALTLHEASPGHHMQISASLLLELPQFRKFSPYSLYAAPFAFPSYTAYIEGWGLYSEYLGEEMNLYKDDYELLGRYSGEIYRACRLVVDTGLHALGWEREQAIEYMLSYTSAGRPDITVEIDRYITWPGQACAYKYGEIKILELRRKAEKELGDKFNLKKFHDVVLGLAAVPLRVLEAAVDEMIQESKPVTEQPRDSGLIIQSSPLVIFISALIMLLTNV